jgi:FkbM family methyltransferase
LNVLKLLLSRKLTAGRRSSSYGVLEIGPNGAPFHFRHATTDKYVIAEVLAKSQYGCLRGRSNVSWIVDAGANIGTSALWLLNEFPEAKLIAIESDPENFAVLEKNLRPFGTRVVCLNKALWSTAEDLMVIHGGFRDGGEWAHQVGRLNAALKHAGEVQGITITQLLAEHQIDTIDILKIDIEGAEREVFVGKSEWLSRVRTIAIELHDTECRKAFVDASRPFGRAISQHGEVTLWENEAMAIDSIIAV